MAHNDGTANRQNTTSWPDTTNFYYLINRWEDTVAFDSFVDTTKTSFGAVTGIKDDGTADFSIHASTLIGGNQADVTINEGFMFTRALSDSEISDIVSTGIVLALEPLDTPTLAAPKHPGQMRGQRWPL